MSINKNYRQGDVFLFPTKIPAELKKSKDNILALGEATNHCHKIFDGDVFVDENGSLFVRATNETELRHISDSGLKADHNAIAVEEGEYRVVIQREYDPVEIRRVSD